MATNQTLQLRHQLSCSGITIQAATYDATRHHVLSYDSSALAPHTLRLFSLRREIKSVRLFDDVNPQPPAAVDRKPQSSAGAKKKQKQSSAKDADAALVPIVHTLSLEYSAANDVYICVYTAQSVPLSRARARRRPADALEEQAVYNVLFLEPASLKKLVHYPGPPSHRLRCVFFESNSDRLVLAVQMKSNDSYGSGSSAYNSAAFGVRDQQSSAVEYHDGDDSDRIQDAESEDPDGMVAEGGGGPMYNHVDILQISKREFKAPKPSYQSASNNLTAAAVEEEQQAEQRTQTHRTMLCIKKAGPSLLHAETISLVCGSKHLTRLFGVGSVSIGGGCVESFLVEWRESSEQRLELIRRVMFRDLISAIALSPCSTWLFTGHESGALRVWNVNNSAGSRKRAMRYELGSASHPLEPEMSSWHGHPIISLRLSGFSSDVDNAIPVVRDEPDYQLPQEAMMVTADRESGVVKHWRFQTSIQHSRPAGEQLDVQGNGVSQGELVAKIDLVGSHNCESSNAGKQHKTAVKQKKSLLESVLCTVPIFVGINMGGFTESLLLVLRDDVIHVLKVQTVMHVLHSTPSGDDISTFRIVEHASAPKLIVLSGNQYSSARILTLDSRYERTENVGYLHQLILPASERSASISAMDCYRVGEEHNFVVFGWSTGSVEVYSLDTNSRVAMLQDPHLNAHVTAVGAVVHTGSQDPKSLQKMAAAHSDPSVVPARSWGGLLRSSAPTTNPDGSAAANNAPSVAFANQRSSVHIFAGTESGQIFEWKVPSTFDPQEPSGSSRLMLESKIRVDSAHSAHVVQLAQLQQQRSGAEHLVSLGADGMVKVWDVLSLAIVGYVNTATDVHMSMPSCMSLVKCGSDDENEFLSVGFEDGKLAVWRLDRQNVSFTELRVASHHERRVTRISAVNRTESSNQSTLSHVAEFVSCSLDMTAIVWTIRGDRVEERRYFDIGAPVVDICTSRNVAVAALANKICAFEFCLAVPASRVDARERVVSTNAGGMVLLPSVGEVHEYYQQSLRPDTPTTHSDGEAENDKGSPNEAAEHMVNALRVPTSLVKAEDAITIPSALITSTKFTRKPPAVAPAAAAQSVDGAARSRKQGGAGANGTSGVHGEELCAMLEAYIESHGTNGTISAESLSHFLSMHRLMVIKRADFAIRKHLQEQKIDLKARLSVYDACEILLAVQCASETRTRNSGKKQQCIDKQAQQDKISKLKTLERSKANRKAVISFNILGEKSIRWESVDPANETALETRRQRASEPEAHKLDPAPALQSPKSPSIRVPTDQTMPAPTEPSADAPPADASDIVSASASAVPVVLKDDDSSIKSQRARRRRNRKLSVAECVTAKAPREFPDHDLICSLRLSQCFRQLWSRGYCWCRRSSELHVSWSDGAADENAKCSDCKKRIHTLTLMKQGYKPHFSLRMILGVIAEVYNELLAPSHSLLFKNASADSRVPNSADAFSIHSTLHRVFTKRFGMQTVVEDKIKLFMVSTTHYIREIDAIAVFGELLAMFVKENSSNDARVPDEMVALCVCSYSWFFSRVMVINGDPILGTNHDPGHDAPDGQAEIENGRRTHWQFVSLQNTLVCAQEMLVYPLVSPGYLRNILIYTGEYAQAYPTKPQGAGDIDQCLDDASTRNRSTQWIEIHRYLRLLVGEWKQHHNEFRAAEHTLFAQPLVEAVPSAAACLKAEVVEKLRLILSCFVFYDHEREGVMAIDDFTSILRKLRYLWPNEHVSAEEAANTTAGEVSLTFENTILAARRRFADVDGDGQICYLDFWAMLYIVGVRTLSLLKFREIPSFCRDYKLEISVDLHGLLLCYMERSSTMMLPRGFHLGKSSLDQRVATQHQRRVGGLHDGVFRMPKVLGSSLSLQELSRAIPMTAEPSELNL